jgi:SAM-dependent methyltransferase
MDRPDLDAAQHFDALRGLARINRWSRAAAAIWKPIAELQREIGQPLRVLDIATGGGDVLCALVRKAWHAGLPIDFAGCDVSPRAVAFAESRAQRLGFDIKFFAADALSDPLPTGFDIIISSLFFHHLEEDAATRLLGKVAAACGSMIVISDLRRGWQGYWLAQLAARILTRSSVVHIDGPRSVRNAFTSEEMLAIARRAGLAGVSVRHCWPRRFLLCWRKGGSTR